jgi:hypothetical protein
MRGKAPLCYLSDNDMGVNIQFVKTQRTAAFLETRVSAQACAPRPGNYSCLIPIGELGVATRIWIGYVRRSVGVSPSGKAPVFGIGIPRFESWHPSHFYATLSAHAQRKNARRLIKECNNMSIQSCNCLKYE